MFKRPIFAIAAIVGIGCTSAFAGAQTVSALKAKYDVIIRNIGMKHAVPHDLIHAIIRAESNYDSRAVSRKGALGLMQLMPETAKAYGVRNPFDPRQNIEGGVRYLKDLIRLYDKNRNLVLAAYNAGQEAVKKYGGIPPYRETRDYIRKISKTYKKTLIMPRTEIFSYVDESGRTVLTNDYLQYKRYKSKKK